MSVPTPVEEGHRDCSVVTATLAMGNSSASVSDLEIGNTDASHAICSIIASGDTPESTPVEVASTGSVHGVDSGVSTESAAPVGRSFSLDPPTAARKPRSF